jgi:putative membrane protein
MADKLRPYTGLEDQLILRDHLAADRTILANERTLLAYIRTALALFIAGLSFIHFEILSSRIPQIGEWIGFIFILLGIVGFFVGFVKYRRMQALIHKIKQEELKELGEEDAT